MVPEKGLSRWRWLRGAVCVLVILYMIIPLLIVLTISFSSAQFLTFPPPGFSLRWYRAVADPVWTQALTTSVLIMIPTALVTTSMGLAASIALQRGRFPGAVVVRGLLMSPLVVPVIITAAALYGLFRAWGLYGTLAGLILAHCLLTLPYAIATTSASLQMIDARLEQAASNLGAGAWTTFRLVTFPLVRPGVLSSFLFALIISFDELVVSLFISAPGIRPVTVQMWSNIRGDVDPTIAALASLLFVFALIILALEALFGKGEAR
jgi:putative spermidine/putrescine transport system permease protein